MAGQLGTAHRCDLDCARPATSRYICRTNDQLATVGETLGAAGISVEGAGMWLVDGVGVAHFLVADGPAGRSALEATGITVVASREVLQQRLNQDEPGQLGKFCRAMADAGVSVEALYCDHGHRLIVVVNDPVTGRHVSESWAAQRDLEHARCGGATS